MSTVATAILELVTDTRKMVSGLDSAVGQAKAFGSKLESTAKGVEAAWGAMSAAMGVLALGAISKEFLDMAGNVADLSARLNVSTDTVQEWQATFGKSGVEIDTVAKASEQLSLKLNGGDKSAVAALQAMGLSVEELQKMKPEDRFIKVADAVGQLQNQDDKIAASKGLFGKGGLELLAALDGHLGETIQQVREMGLVIDGETIQAADKFGDQLGFMGQQLMGILASVIGPLLPALSELGNVLSWLGREVIGPVLNFAIKGLLTWIYTLQEGLSSLVASIVGLGSRLPGVGKYFAQFSEFNREMADKMATLRTNLWKASEATAAIGNAAAPAARKIAGLGEASGAAAPKHKEQADRLTELAEKAAAAARAMEQSIGRGIFNSGPAANRPDSFGGVDTELARARAALAELGTMTDGYIDIGVKLSPTEDAYRALVEMVSRTAEATHSAVADAIGTLPNLLTQAFTGGGGLGGALKAFTSQIGGNIGRGLFEAGGLLNGVGNKLAGVFGSAFGLALPGIGQALGALVGPVMGKLFSVLKNIGGPSQQELGGRDAEKKFEDSFGGFDKMMARIGDAYAATGRTRQQAEKDIKSLLDAEKQGPEAVKKWIDSLQAVIDQADAATQATADAQAKATSDAEAARDARLKTAKDEIDGLVKQREDLAAGIAQEAVEEDMGVIERAQRDQLASLDAQIQAKNDAFARLAEDTAQTMKAAIEEALASIRVQPVHVPAVLDAPGGLKDGADAVLGASQGAGDVVINLEGREIARGALPYLAQAAEAYGVTG